MSRLGLYLSLGPPMWSFSECQVLVKRYWKLGQRFSILQTLSCLSEEVTVKNSIPDEVQVHL